jgi:hypothetical protein
MSKTRTVGASRRSLALGAALAMMIALVPPGTALAMGHEDEREPRDPQEDVCPPPADENGDNGDEGPLAFEFHDGDDNGDGGFRDVDPEGVHADNIECMADYGIAQGYGDGTYGPGDDVTRAQMAAFIHDMIVVAGAPIEWDGDDDDHFDDVADLGHDRFRDSINALASVGIVQGIGDRRYNPTGRVTRAQMAAFIADATDYAQNGAVDGSIWLYVPYEDESFEDTEQMEAERLQRSIHRLAAAMVVVGFEDGTYLPMGNVTRAQMASFIMRGGSYLHINGSWEPTAPAQEAEAGQYEGESFGIDTTANALDVAVGLGQEPGEDLRFIYADGDEFRVSNPETGPFGEVTPEGFECAVKRTLIDQDEDDNRTHLDYETDEGGESSFHIMTQADLENCPGLEADDDGDDGAPLP